MTRTSIFSKLLQDLIPQDIEADESMLQEYQKRGDDYISGLCTLRHEQAGSGSGDMLSEMAHMATVLSEMNVLIGYLSAKVSAKSEF